MKEAEDGSRGVLLADLGGCIQVSALIYFLTTTLNDNSNIQYLVERKIFTGTGKAWSIHSER